MFKIVKVRWLDAMSEDSWTDIDVAIKQECPLQETVGYLLRQDEKTIVLAASLDVVNKSVASIYSIPQSWCIEVIEI